MFDSVTLEAAAKIQVKFNKTLRILNKYGER